MERMFIGMILGHFVGDYLLQSRRMALQKGEPGLSGALRCTFHCLVYTLSVCAFGANFSPAVMGLVFLSHWPIDRWSLAGKWLRLIRGRDIQSARRSTSEFREVDLSFACLVYAVADNTMHVVLLWLLASLL